MRAPPFLGGPRSIASGRLLGGEVGNHGGDIDGAGATITRGKAQSPAEAATLTCEHDRHHKAMTIRG